MRVTTGPTTQRTPVSRVRSGVRSPLMVMMIHTGKPPAQVLANARVRDLVPSFVPMASWQHSSTPNPPLRRHFADLALQQLHPSLLQAALLHNITYYVSNIHNITVAVLHNNCVAAHIVPDVPDWTGASGMHMITDPPLKCGSLGTCQASQSPSHAM